MVLSTTAIKVDSMYKDCELTSRVMVSWIECSPYIFYAKNSISNTTVFTAKGKLTLSLLHPRSIPRIILRWSDKTNLCSNK